MHRLNRYQTVEPSYGVYVFLFTALLGIYAFWGGGRSEQQVPGPAHPIHSVCSTRYRPESETYQSISKAVDDASSLYGVSADLISAVIVTESGCRVAVRSRRGAVGLMQLMPGTAKELGIANPYSVRENIFGGTKYLAQLLRIWDGNKELALASYNAGPAKVRKYKEIPPYKETQHYVKRVLHVFRGLENRRFDRT